MNWISVPTKLSSETIAALQVSLEREVDQSEMLVLASSGELHPGDDAPTIRYVRNSPERHMLMGDVARDLIEGLLSELDVVRTASMPQVMMRTFGLEPGRLARFPGAFATNSAAPGSIGFILQLPTDSSRTETSRRPSASLQSGDIRAVPGRYVLFDYPCSVAIESTSASSPDWFLLGSIAP